MYITSCSSFLRSCQNTLTPVSASGKDKPWYISLLWTVRTEESFRYSSTWDTLPSSDAEGVMVHDPGPLLFHGQCIFLAASVQWLCDPSGAASLGFTDSSFGPTKADFWGGDLLQQWAELKLGKPLLDCKGAHSCVCFYSLCNFLELPKHFQSWVTRICFLWSREQIVSCHLFPQKVLTISWYVIIGAGVQTVLSLLNSPVIPFPQLHGCT